MSSPALFKNTKNVLNTADESDLGKSRHGLVLSHTGPELLTLEDFVYIVQEILRKMGFYANFPLKSLYVDEIH